MHNVAYLPYYSEVLAFVVLGHLFVFRIVGNNVNAGFVALKAFYKGSSPVVDGVDSVCAAVAEVIIKDDVVVKKSRFHGVAADIGCTHIFPVFFKV